jgi:hypothetical protein
MSLKKILLAGVAATLLSACAGTLPSLTTLPAQTAPQAFEQPIATDAPLWPTVDWWKVSAAPNSII